MQFVFQAGRTAEPLVPPTPEAAISLYSILALAALNPVAIAVAVLMGRHADNGARLGIAAFAGAIAGIAALWLDTRFGFGFARAPARAASGIFVVSCFCCLGWAWLGRRLWPVRRD